MTEPEQIAAFIARSGVTRVVQGEGTLRHWRGRDWRNAARGEPTVDDLISQRHVVVGADLSDADLRDADLSAADLRHADLRAADLRHADLRTADLIYADLSGANLSGANLSGANLSGANLGHADLSGANLSSADLIGANLRGANLIGANLRGADVRGAEGYTCLGWDRRGYHFRATLHAFGWQITAGCRDFTVAQAVEHWTKAGNREALARVAILQALTVA